jgi:acrylyl-CoA reductase (NADPH)
VERFRALVLDQADGALRRELQELPLDALPDDNVLVRVEYSDLNYKDGLAVTGAGKIVRSFPMVAGIDFAGTVEASESERYRPGDRVLCTGWGLSERHWGGYAQMARVPDEWLVPIPEGLDARWAMGLGTAGFTAMLCVMALEDFGMRWDGEVVVTGATGGVGSVAVAILAALGYSVVASTGKRSEEAYLTSLGAASIIDRSMLAENYKALGSQRWSGAVDTVGGDTLAGLISTMKYHAPIAACGNAGGQEFRSSVYPFILRAVALLGVESVVTPGERRQQAWRRLAEILPPDTVEAMTRVAPFSEVPDLAGQIVQGQIRGRIIVDVNA